MGHIYSQAAESILDKEFLVLDKGFIRLIDYMGSDQSIVQAARVSYGAGTKTVREDRGLIRYLLRHDHTTPFEMVVLKFHIKAPLFVVQQWIRHRTASINQESGRYSVLKDEFHVLSIDDVCVQSKDNKQGRGEKFNVTDAEVVLNVMSTKNREAYTAYETLLEMGMARESAREILPVSTYTQFYWQMNLHNLLHFLKLRLDPHAQKEIREYAEQIAVCVQAVAPNAWEAFEDYKKNGASFSVQELDLLKSMLGDNLYDDAKIEGLGKSEQKEFLAKLRN